MENATAPNGTATTTTDVNTKGGSNATDKNGLENLKGITGKTSGGSESKVSKNGGDPGKEEAGSSEVKKDEPRTDGKREFTIDGKKYLLDDKQQTAWIQKSIAAEKRIQESNQSIERFDRLVSMLKTKEGVIKILSHPDIGHDVRKFAEGILSEHLEEEMLTPEQKQLKTANQKLSEYENEKKTRAEAVLKEKFNKAYEGAVDKHQKDLIDTLESSGLPKSNFVVKRMIETVLNARKLGHNISFKDVVPHIKEQLNHEWKEHLTAYDAVGLKNFLGDEVASKLREANLSPIIPEVLDKDKNAGSEQFGEKKKKTTDKTPASMSQFKQMFNK